MLLYIFVHEIRVSSKSISNESRISMNHVELSISIYVYKRYMRYNASANLNMNLNVYSV